MSEQPGSGRLDADTIAAYLDGQLPPEARALVEARLAADPETYEWVVNAVQTREELEFVETESAIAAGGGSPPRDPEWAEVLGAGARRSAPVLELSAPGAGTNLRQATQRVLPFYKRGSVKVAIGVALMAAAALVLMVRQAPEQGSWLAAFPFRRGTDADPRFAKLVAAVGEERYIEGRLTGGFKYGPLRSITRGPGDLSNQNLALLAAAGELQKAAQADPNAENLHAWGVAQLLLAQWDGAVATLEQAAAATPNNADVQSDLAAAYVGRAAAIDSPGDWPRALTAAERALAVKPGSLSAAFNRALSLEGLFLNSQAVQQWRNYLILETDSRWRQEAQRRLARLEERPDARTRQRELLERTAAGDLDAARQLAREFPRVAREYVEDSALPEWAGSIARDPAAAELRLTICGALVSALSARRDTPHALLDDVRASVKDGTIRPLAESLTHFGRGRALFVDGKYGDSVRDFEAVVARHSSVALALSSRMHLAIARYYAGQMEDAAVALLDVQSEARLLNLSAIEARCHWMIGIIRGAQNRFTESLLHYESARARYEELDERDHVATANQLLADGYAALGDFDGCWLLLRRALEHWASDWNPRRQMNALMLGALAARRASMPELQLAFQRAVMDLDRVAPDSVAKAESLADAARAQVQLEDVDAALVSIAGARAALSGIADVGLRRQVSARVDRAEAIALEFAAPETAISRLQEVADEYERSGQPLPLAEVYRVLGGVLRREHRDRDAERVLARAIQLIEAQRAAPPAPLRISYFDGVWSLYQDLIDLYLAQGRDAEALQIAEMGRSRVLGDTLGTRPVDRTLLTQVSNVLRTHEAIVFYCELPGRVAAWVIRRDGARVYALPHGAATVAGEIELAFANVQLDPRPFLARGYDELWRPFANALASVTRVYIVPDGALAHVPFAALLDAASGRYLVEAVTVSAVPGLRFVAASPSPAARASGSALVVAASDAAGSLPALPHAASEAESVAGIYGVRAAVDLFDGAAFSVASRDSSVIHFAGHAVANTQYPALSRLVLRAGQGGELFAHQIEQLVFRGRPTVVLSACATARGAMRRGEGSLSLARPFLAAGARAVVASLFPVNDATAPALIVPLHEHLAGGKTAAEALAVVQRQLAAGSRRPPRDWAGFAVIDTPIQHAHAEES